MTSFPKKIDLDFAQIEVYEDYLISTVNEGVVFDFPHLEKIHEIFDTFFPDKFFGFISNRINDYSVNPICFSNHTLHPRLLGVAILCHSKSSFKISHFVMKFYIRPFKVFYSMSECKNWIDKLNQK